MRHHATVTRPYPALALEAQPYTPIMKIGGEVGYRLLRWLKPGNEFRNAGESLDSYIPVINRVLGANGWESLRDKTILDFGCGIGAGCIDMARRGAKRVIGLDIRQEALAVAREAAKKAGVSSICTFCREFDEPVDVIVSKDSSSISTIRPERSGRCTGC